MPESVLASDSSSESVASASTLSLLVTAAEQNAIGTTGDALNWDDIEAPVWNAVMVNLGRVGKLRFFAALLSVVLVVAGSSQRDARSHPWKRPKWNWLGEWHVSDSDFQT